jgi:glycosyltransferase involved in cell wall biosynthesis
VRDRAAALPGLRWLGPLDPPGVAAAMRAARAVVVPSVCFEGLPTAVLEAFAHGRPVVCTALGALPELVAGGAGWACPPEPAALAEALRTAADPAAATAAGRAARARYETAFTPAASLAALLAIYREVTGATAAARA